MDEDQLRRYDENIPNEMKRLDQWLISAGKVPMMSLKGSRFLSYFEARSRLTQWVNQPIPANLGFVFKKQDNLIGLDLDFTGEPVDKWLDYAKSYGERSLSGKHVHIIFKGDKIKNNIVNLGEISQSFIPGIYANNRFFVITGDVCENYRYLSENPYLLEWCASQASRAVEIAKPVETFKPVEQIGSPTISLPDESLIKEIERVADPLFTNALHGIGRPGEVVDLSNLDYLIMCKIVKYTQNEEQAKRLFLYYDQYRPASGINGDPRKSGKLERKGNPKDYLVRTFVKAIKSVVAERTLVSSIQQNVAPQFEPIKIDLNLSLLKAKTKIEQQSSVQALQSSVQEPQAFVQVPSEDFEVASVSGESAAWMKNIVVSDPKETLRDDTLVDSDFLESLKSQTNFKDFQGAPELSNGCGFFNMILNKVLESSSVPRKEAALPAILAGMSALIGSSYNVTSVPLNLFMIVLGEAGSGKSNTKNAFTRIMDDAFQGEFHNRGGSLLESAEGLLKTLESNPSRVLYIEEFADVFSKSRTNDFSKKLIGVLKTLFDGSNVPASMHSKKENRIALILNPRLSIYGESTIENYFTQVSYDDLKDGFMSRFLHFVLQGLIPYHNESCRYVSDLSLNENLRRFSEILQDKHMVEVKISNEVKTYWRTIGRELTDRINRDASYAINVRSFVYRKKIAAVHAVTNNPVNPIIQIHDAEFADSLVDHSMYIMNQQFGNAVSHKDVTSEHERLAVLRTLLENLKAARKPLTLANIAVRYPLDMLLPNERRFSQSVVKNLLDTAVVYRMVNCTLQKGEWVYSI